MTAVQFHFNVQDRMTYACRLLRKALRTVDGISVVGNEDELEKLNLQLWAFEPTEFLPHVFVRSSSGRSAARDLTPLWLVPDLTLAPPSHSVLVNLRSEPVVSFEQFTRLVEVVSTRDDDREAARTRWRHYTKMGYAIEKFEVKT